jgi:hypothetical protein
MAAWPAKLRNSVNSSASVSTAAVSIDPLNPGDTFRVVSTFDDNIIGNKKYAKELFKALVPLKIRGGGQSSVSFVRDSELMDLVKRSGCRGSFIGLESVVDNTIHKYNKLKNLEDTE